MENAAFVGEGHTGATSDSPARNGIRRSATPRRRTAPPLRTTGCLNEPESTLPYWLSDFLVRRVLAHRCTSQRIWFTRFKQGPQAHRPLRFVWKNNFDPWALRIFGRHNRSRRASSSPYQSDPRADGRSGLPGGFLFDPEAQRRRSHHSSSGAAVRELSIPRQGV